MTDTLTPQAALETIELFVNNLLEYVENVTDGDYESKEDAISTIAGDEKAFWDSLTLIAKKSGATKPEGV